MLVVLIRYALLGLAVLAINFALPRWLPGDPLDVASADGVGSGGPPLSLQQRAQLRAAYRLDQPLVEQFGGYLGDLAHADLGWSISRAAPVAQLIGERLPWTLGLVLTAVLVAGLAGASVGWLAAWHGGGWDRAVVGACTAVAALPEFLVGLLLLLGLSVGLGWFPLHGGETAFAPAGESWLASLVDRGRHLVLPALTLVVANLAGFALLSRAAARGVRRAPYLAPARGKGLTERQVALGHALPNAVLPVLTLLGVRLGMVLGGALVVERVFGVPGLGLFAFQAVQARDYPVLQAVFVLVSLGVLLANLLTELAYRWLAPQPTRQAEPGRVPGYAA